VKAPKFSYVRATSVAHAVKLLAEYGDDARILAGGQSLMPTLNMRLSRPKLLIDINHIEALQGITFDGMMVRIGAVTRHAEILHSHMAAKYVPLITAALPHVAHVAVRNRGTFGGSVALADPAAEMPACLLALNGRIVLESIRGRREVAAEDYFHGLYQTAREPDELLVEALIQPEPPGMQVAFHELARRHGDFALAGVAARASLHHGKLHNVRLVYFGSEVKPALARNAMSAAEGKDWSEATRNAVNTALARDLDPMDNNLGKPATKLHWQRVLTARALDDISAKAIAA
jgi:aerobic carbon-monoxide dehydrogenase medium subunit